MIRTKEAIDILKRYEYSTRLELSEGIGNDLCDHITVSDFMDMKDLAIDSLEKQIPKRIDVSKNEHRPLVVGTCSNCEEVLTSSTYKYCRHCGQALLVSEIY